MPDTCNSAQRNLARKMVSSSSKLIALSVSPSDVARNLFLLTYSSQIILQPQICQKPNLILKEGIIQSRNVCRSSFATVHMTCKRVLWRRLATWLSAGPTRRPSCTRHTCCPEFHSWPLEPCLQLPLKSDTRQFVPLQFWVSHFWENETHGASLHSDLAALLTV